MLAGIAIMVVGAWLIGQSLVGNLAGRLFAFARNPSPIAGGAAPEAPVVGGGGGGKTVQ